MIPGNLICRLHDVTRQARLIAGVGKQFMELLGAQAGVLHEPLLVSDGLAVAIVFFVKGVCALFFKVLGQQVLLCRAEQGEQTLRLIGLLLHRAVLVLRLLVIGQFQADAIIQCTKPRLVARKPQHALLMGQVERQFKGVA